MHPRITAFSSCLPIVFLVILVALVTPLPVSAGCGCDKPPLAPAAVVPNFAFPGMTVTLFDSRLQAGQQGSVAADLSLNTQFAPGSEPWEVETAEEGH